MRTFDSVYNTEGHRRARVLDGLKRLTPEERHRKFLADYDRFYGGGAASAAARAQVLSRPTTSDAQVLQDTFRFIRSDQDDADDTWEARMARRYYAKLFKEYCIADLSRYKEQKIGMRWRVEKEVVVGKGQFSCGNKRCDARNDLGSYEVHFGYQEAGEKKEALVKLRACEGCAYKLNYGRTTAIQKVTAAAAGGRRKERRRGGGESGRGKRSTKRRRTAGGKQPEGESEESEELESSSSEEEEDAKEEEIGPTGEAGEDIWLGKANQGADAEPTKDEEFDQYFTDMFV
eukprot:CAMPEP_0181358292 /NCGR_PEP_ID=MMETSP1106-20121128/5433_1 /TAXON_ID=81844 /ORGANISM="Mantoniella antarctica, Strain SL-175" /LENGTH=288 /DNA_ID=CAMNT_0023471245 /DNA_START=262 /DNA_END=1128 /DNA_ORIENTATION=+